MSSLNVKISDLVAQFDGTSDFSEWVRKLELVARLQKLDKLENYLPLFLTGGAFAVYEALNDADKDDFGKMKAALTKAFSLNCFAAYERLTRRCLDHAEPVDVYLADVRRLAGLVCAKPDDSLVKCAFVCGLPDHIKTQLQAVSTLDSLPLFEVAERARVLLSHETAHSAAAAAARTTSRSQPTRPRPSLRRCFICNSAEHLIRNCPLRADRQASEASTSAEQLTGRCDRRSMPKNV